MRSWAPCLGHRDFRLYFAGQVASWFGTWMQQIALGWWAYRVTGSVGWLAAVAICSQLPILALGPWAATLADHVERRRALMITQTLSLVQAVVLLLVFISGSSPIYLIIGCSLALGVVNAFDIPIRQSYQVHLVPERDVFNSVAIMSATANFTRLVAPAVAGLLIAYVGEGVCFAINAASFMMIIWTLSRLPSQEPAAKRAEGMGTWESFSEGTRHALADPWMTLGLAMAVGISLFAGPYMALMPALMQVGFGAGVEIYGVAMGMSGLGAMVAGLSLAARPQWLGKSSMGVLGVIGASALGAMTQMPNAYWAMPLLFLTGFGLSGSANIANAMIQHRVNSAMRGRVMGLFSMCLYGGAPLGALSMGIAAEIWGPRLAIGVGAGCAALSFAAIAWRVHVLRASDREAKILASAAASEKGVDKITHEEAWVAAKPEVAELACGVSLDTKR